MAFDRLIVFVSRNGQELGDFYREDLDNGVQNAQFKDDDLVWHREMVEWKPLGKILSMYHQTKKSTSRKLTFDSFTVPKGEPVTGNQIKLIRDLGILETPIDSHAALVWIEEGLKVKRDKDYLAILNSSRNRGST